jgi:hypothetical protein
MSGDNGLPRPIAFGMRYSDAVSWDEQGRTSADIRRVSVIEPDLAASQPAPDLAASQPATAVSEQPPA